MRAKSTVGDVAGIPVELVGDHPITSLVASELPSRSLRRPAGHILVHSGDLPPLTDSTSLSTISVAANGLQIRFPRSGFALQIDLPVASGVFNARLAIAERPRPYGIPKWLFRWAEPTFLTPLEAQAYAFLHLILEALLFLYSDTHVPLHAAAVERDNQALLLTSSGGVGKTTTSMALLDAGRWSYLSDDMTMLSADAWVQPYQRHPMVYGYNLASHSHMQRAVVTGRGLAGRLQWMAARPIHGPKRRRRVEPGQLYGREVLGASSHVECVAFLSRAACREPSVRRIEPEELARRSSAILATEFVHLLENLKLAEAGGAPDLVCPLLAKATLQLETAFSRVSKLYEVSLPDTTFDVQKAVNLLEGLFES